MTKRAEKEATRARVEAMKRIDEQRVLAMVDEDLGRVILLEERFLPQMEARGYTRHELEEFFIWKGELRTITKMVNSEGITDFDIVSVMPGRDIPSGERLTELERELEKYFSDSHLTEQEKGSLISLTAYYFTRRRELQRQVKP